MPSKGAHAGTSCCNGPAVASKTGELLMLMGMIVACPPSLYLAGREGIFQVCVHLMLNHMSLVFSMPCCGIMSEVLEEIVCRDCVSCAVANAVNLRTDLGQCIIAK